MTLMQGPWKKRKRVEQLPSVYFVRANTLRRFKIGRTTNLESRLCELQCGCPSRLVLMGTIECHDTEEAKELEWLLHENFSAVRTIGEWFWLDKIARSKIRCFVDGYQACDLIPVFLETRSAA